MMPMPDPDWLLKARSEGRIREHGVNAGALVRSSDTKTEMFPQFLSDHDMSEKRFQGHVIDLAHTHGWKISHFRPVQVQDKNGTHWETPVAADGKGWPDLFMAKAGFLPVYAELKVKANVPRPEQWEWIHLLRACGCIAKVWYPSDWSDIVQTLANPSDVPESLCAALELHRLADDGCPHAGDREAA